MSKKILIKLSTFVFLLSFTAAAPDLTYADTSIPKTTNAEKLVRQDDIQTNDNALTEEKTAVNENNKKQSRQKNKTKETQNLSKFQKLWTELPLDIEQKHFYDPLSIFLGEMSSSESGTRLTLSKTLQIAIENSVEIAKAKSMTKEAYYRIDEVKSAKGIIVNATGSGSYSQPIAQMNLNGTTVDMGEAWNWSAGITASYLITNFGLFEDTRKAAWISYVSAKMDEERLLKELYNDISSSYLTTLELSGLYMVAQSAVEVRNSQLEIAKANYEEGVAPKYDMLTMQVNLKTAEQNLIIARRNLEQAKSNLRNRLGIPQTEDFFVVKPPYFHMTHSSLEESIQQAYLNRTEMQQMDIALEIAKTNVNIASQGSNPSLTWNNSYTLRNEVTGSNKYSWSSGLSLNIPIFDGGATKARTEQAKELLNQAILDKTQLERDIAMQIKDATLQIDENKQRLFTAEASVDMAKEAYLIALVRYQESVGTFLELDDATTNYLEALATLSSAYCAYERSLLNMLYSIGIIVEEVDKYELHMQNQ